MPRPRSAPPAETPNQAKYKEMNERTHRVKTVGDHQSNDVPFEPETAERTGNGAMSLNQVTSISAVNHVITTILMCFVSKFIVS